MILSPRPYQSAAIERVREHGRAGRRRVVLVSPTASGKTIMAGAIIESAVAKGSKILFLAHRKELIDQPSRLLDEMGIDHGVIRANHWRHRPHLPIQVASMQTLLRREFPPADLVVVDEAHRAAGESYTKILERYPNAFRLLLTATPWRLDGRGLAEYADAIVEVAQVQELIDQGYLCPLRVYAPDNPDLSGVKKSRGDYDQRQLAAVMNRTALVGKIVEEWKRLGEDRRTVVYASSVEHSQDLAQRFRDAGIHAEHVDGEMDDVQRESILGRLTDGTTRVVCQCDLLVEGYDLPSLGCVVLARPTHSLTRYLQACGRAMRVEDGKPYAIVLDHAGCVNRHGLPTDPRVWSLEDRKKGTKDPFVELAKCEQCGAIFPASRQACPNCTAKQVEVFRGLPVEEDGELVEVRSTYECEKCSSDKVRVERHDDLQIKTTCRACGSRSYRPDKHAAKMASETRRRAEYERLVRVQTERGFKEGWVSIQYRNLFGSWPPREWRPQRPNDDYAPFNE